MIYKNYLNLSSFSLLWIDKHASYDAAQSQDAGLRHRRDGLAYRLHLTDEKKEWRPPKRVQPDCGSLDIRRKTQQILRMELATQSHIAFKQALDAGKFSVFTSAMDPILDRYYALTHLAWKNFARRFKRFALKTILRRRKFEAYRQASCAFVDSSFSERGSRLIFVEFSRLKKKDL